MAKDNLFLGYARGSVGDVVFSRLNGQQVSRARNRNPRNPQTVSQVVQRVILATAGKAYSMFREIADHSFQGFEPGSPSQQEFMRLNVAAMRDQVAAVLAYPTAENIQDIGAEYTDFNFNGDELPVARDFIISSGTLPTPALYSSTTSGAFPMIVGFGVSTIAALTYQVLVDTLGLQRGDQLTFLWATHDFSSIAGGDFINGFRFARVILEPANGDMTTAFIAADGTVNSPNERNEGTITFAIDDEQMLQFVVDGLPTTATGTNGLAAVGVIASRYSGNVWQRSNSILHVANATSFANKSLLEAWLSYLTETSSGLYLNQATVG